MAVASLPDTKGAEQKASDLGADSTRIAWAFLSQYYSFLNKDPSRLHCFYTKRSTLIHSTEGADVVPCYGQQEIHAKIMELAFEDCKVYISNVDSQSSAEGGIIVQVLGEQSNRGGSWRKFSQTFFLAEQPNGYFVLNDICRFLKEEGIEDDAEASVAGSDNAAVEALFDDASFPTPSESALENGVTHPAGQVETEHEPIPQAFGEFKADEQATPQPNGVHHEREEQPVDVPAPGVPEEAAAGEVETQQSAEVPIGIQEDKQQSEASSPVGGAPSRVEPEPEQKEEIKAVEKAPKEQQAPKSTPAASSPTVGLPVAVEPPVEPPVDAATIAEDRAPAPAAAPAAPKSWASLAAAAPSKFGSAVTEKKGISSAAPPTPPPASVTERSTPASNTRPLTDAVLSINTPHCFVKGVVETITDKALRDVLVRFGPIREFDIIRSKACAFIEFERVDSARRAIQVSMRVSEGGEGGITMAPGTIINVVERKSPGDRPPPRPRGGGTTGEDRTGGGAGRGPYRGTGSREGGSSGGTGGVQRSNTAGEDSTNRGSGAGRGGSKANRGTRTKTAK